jgi:hypothetical protein
MKTKKIKTEITVFATNLKTGVYERLGSLYKNKDMVLSDFTWDYRDTHYNFRTSEKEVKQ